MTSTKQPSTTASEREMSSPAPTAKENAKKLAESRYELLKMKEFLLLYIEKARTNGHVKKFSSINLTDSECDQLTTYLDFLEMTNNEKGLFNLEDSENSFSVMGASLIFLEDFLSEKMPGVLETLKEVVLKEEPGRASYGRTDRLLDQAEGTHRSNSDRLAKLADLMSR